MATINLRPWREERRARLQDELVKATGLVLIIGLCVWFAWNQVVNGWVDNQNQRNQMLNAEISSLEVKVKEIQKLKERKQDLISRMEVIQGLQGRRPLIVYLFDALAKTIPEGLFYTKLERKGSKIFIEGTSESNQRVSTLMRNLDESEWFAAPNLTKVVANLALGEQGNDFELTVDIAAPGGEGEDETESVKGK